MTQQELEEKTDTLFILIYKLMKWIDHKQSIDTEIDTDFVLIKQLFNEYIAKDKKIGDSS